MQVNFHLVKSFLRQALRDSNGNWVDDPQTAIDALSQIQTEQHGDATDADTTMISSTTGGKTFQFQVTPGLSRANLLAITEKAIEEIEKFVEANDEREASNQLTDSELVTAIRKRILKTTPRTRADFSSR